MKMNKSKMGRNGLLSFALCCTMAASAGTIDVKQMKYAGPYAVATPVMLDSVDIKACKFDLGKLLDSPMDFTKVTTGSEVNVTTAPGSGKENALHLLAFTIDNRTRLKATIAVDGLKEYRLFVDGEAAKVDADKAEVALTPSTHTVVIKYLTRNDGQSDPLKVRVTTDEGKTITLGAPSADTKRAYDIYDVICGANYQRVTLSPDGKYMMVRKTWADRQGKSYSKNMVLNYTTGKMVGEWTDNVQWMPNGSRLYLTRKGDKGQELVTINPSTMEQQIVADRLPEGRFEVTPDEKRLVYTLTTEGRQKDPQVYDVKSPEDRQPGWRNRTQLAVYDLETGILQPLTFGYHNVYLNDISADSRYALVGKSEERLTKRPTTVTSLYRIDLQTLATDTLISRGEFIGRASFSPDGKSLLVTGTPEAFDGIGKDVEPGQTPSMTDQQLFLMTVADRKVRPLTKTFDPCVSQAEWSRADGNVYLTAEDKDCVHLFRLNPTSGKITRIDTPEEYIKDFSLAKDLPALAFSGQSASNADRLYKVDTKALKSVLVDDLSARLLKGVELGECKPWNFVNERGDTLCCRYYLPPHFDASKKYPMVVNYYGGCSPTSRTFQSRYPQHVYAAMGYVVLIVNPSGATGFGQKFSARHVDTAGEGVAEDIIASTQAFCREHSFVNSKKIGCIGASYGGFMTQYLQTRTDIFAAAISHAGISDHTSYWGNGYWGYSYSEVSMANEYPWTNKHLFVDQSPLYNADKIHTPLLFVHGTADNNVPVGESIQLYTALKLLGRPTAMVLVDGQDHHILDYQKRLKWQDTIFAWFAKWLQDDDSWWNEMYGNEQM